VDDVVAIVEREIDPMSALGVPPPATATLAMGLRFAALSLRVNVAVVVLTLFAGLGFRRVLPSERYLLGFEYFERIAVRHMPRAVAEELRRRNWGPVYFAGLIISGFVIVPVLNLAHAAFCRRLYGAAREAPCLTGTFTWSNLSHWAFVRQSPQV
jgi:CysZ protein